MPKIFAKRLGYGLILFCLFSGGGLLLARSYFQGFPLKAFVWEGQERVLNLPASHKTNEPPLLSFVVLGHPYPAAQDLGFFDQYLERNNLRHLLIVGDLGGTAPFWERLAQKQTYSIEAVPGNADIHSREDYQTFVQKWGNYRKVERQNTTFLFLNSEDCADQSFPHRGCWFQGKQLEFLKAQLQASSAQTQHLVLLVHHLFWWRGMNPSQQRQTYRLLGPLTWEFLRQASWKVALTSVLRGGNCCARAIHDPEAENTWWQEIHPLLAKRRERVLVFGGDSSFNAHVVVDQVHYFHTGLRNPEWQWFSPDEQEFFQVNLWRDAVQVKHVTFPRQK